MTEPTVTLTESQLRGIVKEAVHEVLVTMGIEASEPIEMQKDFQHLRDWRQSVEAVKRKGMLTIAGILVTGLCGAAYLGFTQIAGK